MRRHEWLVDAGNDRRVRCYAAATPESRRVGLQAFDGLGDDEGLLFLFDTPGHHMFHMASVAFPIDLVWTLNNRVTRVASGWPGEQTRWSGPADKVLETNFGRAAALGLRKGSWLDFRQLVTAQEDDGGRPPELADPAAFAYQIAPKVLQMPLAWEGDRLTGGSTTHAVVTTAMIRAAVEQVSVTDIDVVREAALSPEGLDALGTALIAMGACDVARTTPYGIVLQRL